MIDECNWHTLRRLREEHGEENIRLMPASGPSFPRAFAVYLAGQDEPLALFAELTEGCAC